MVSKVAKTMRILIADNEFSVSNALSALIREQPAWHLIGIVSDGDDLLGAIDTCRPDLVLIDFALPGLKLADFIRKNSDSVFPPFVVAICKDQDERKEAFAYGVDFAICKIEPPDRLLEALHESQEKITQVS
jgi:DNA-binding NarL/FixJ family response regulator